jgi:hypothetical protein
MTPGWRAHAKIHAFPEFAMEAEQLNPIGTQLVDLSARTQALRGYL